MDHHITVIVITAIIATIFIAPAIVLWPVMRAIAMRISGKTASSDEIKVLRAQVKELQDQVHAMSTRMLAIEDGHEFSKKMLEDVVKKSSGK